MRDSFPEAEVAGYEALIPEMTNHPKDRHVLAAAVTSGARLIVTENTKDFPTEALAGHGVERVTADQFLRGLCRARPHEVYTALETQASRLREQPTVAQLLESLERSCPSFTREVRSSRTEQVTRPRSAPFPERAEPRPSPSPSRDPGREIG